MASKADPSMRAADGMQTMFIRETSPCWQRLTLGFFRSLTLVVSQGDKDGPELLRFQKPCHCSYCGRPRFKVYDSQGTHLGNVETSRCRSARVFDADNNLKYKLSRRCCQLGKCIPCLYDIKYSVKDQDGEPEAEVRKIFTWNELFGVGNSFKVVYPNNAKKEEKALYWGSHCS